MARADVCLAAAFSVTDEDQCCVLLLTLEHGGLW